MLKKIFIILLLSFFSGCATAADTVAIKNEANKMDLSDGVSKNEAIIIAQNKMIEEGLEKEYDISNPYVRYEDDKEWGVGFWPKFSLSKTAPVLKYLVSINKNNGEITGFGQAK